jgi:hypothetical protein
LKIERACTIICVTLLQPFSDSVKGNNSLRSLIKLWYLPAVNHFINKAFPDEFEVVNLHGLDVPGRFYT